MTQLKTNRYRVECKEVSPSYARTQLAEHIQSDSLLTFAFCGDTYPRTSRIDIMDVVDSALQRTSGVIECIVCAPEFLNYSMQEIDSWLESFLNAVLEQQRIRVLFAFRANPTTIHIVAIQ